MDLDRFKVLLSGQEPNLDDFAFFVELSESAEPKILWSLLTDNPKLHAILKNIVNKSLQDKIPRQKNAGSSAESVGKNWCLAA